MAPYDGEITSGQVELCVGEEDPQDPGILLASSSVNQHSDILRVSLLS